MSTSLNVLMVGLPESGKSTYLGALFHNLKNGGADGLSLTALPDEREYLIELENRWLSLMPLEHSGHHGPRRVDLPISDSAAGTDLNLLVPDVVGEEFENAWEHGGWTGDVAACVTDCDAILLFVRADAVVEPELIAVSGKSPASASKPRRDWEATLSPTQAKLCDLLEQIRDLRSGLLPPIAILVSAWDEAAASGLAPDDWLSWRVPLLSQWVATQEPGLSYRSFGISAQGGDVSKGNVRKKLAQNAGVRPLPESGSTLTAPLRWLLTSAVS